MKGANVAILGSGSRVQRFASRLGRTIGGQGYNVSLFEDPVSLVSGLHEHDVHLVFLVPATVPGGSPEYLPMLVHRTRPQARVVFVADGSAPPPAAVGGSWYRVVQCFDDVVPLLEEWGPFRDLPCAEIPDNILVTGGLGFLGKALVRRLLASTEATLWLLVRPRDGMSPQGRVEAAFRGCDSGRLRVLQGDLVPGDVDSGRGFGSDLDLVRANGPEAVEELLACCNGVLHVGAYLSFLDREDERRRLFEVNVGGTTRLLSLVRRFHRPLICFDYVSTAFVHGTLAAPAALEEDDLCPSSWCNFYEHSKWIGETIVRSSGFPWRIFRPPIICEDLDSDELSAETIYGILDVVAVAVAKERKRGTTRLHVRIPTHARTLTNFIYRQDLARMIVDVVRSGTGTGHVYNTVNPERFLGTIFWETLAEHLGFQWEACPTVPRRPRNLVEALFYRVVIPRYEGYLYRSFPRPVQDNLRRLLGNTYPETTARRIGKDETRALVEHHLQILGSQPCRKTA